MNKELETIIENEFDCLINDLGCLMGEEWIAESIKKVVNQAFSLHAVSHQRELLKIIFDKHLEETGYIDLRIDEANTYLDNF
tara:strand:+ start:333 stop:578 length:246 start_codon:yes stop_codon:yes gene_type:complete